MRRALFIALIGAAGCAPSAPTYTGRRAAGRWIEAELGGALAPGVAAGRFEGVGRYEVIAAAERRATLELWLRRSEASGGGAPVQIEAGHDADAIGARYLDATALAGVQVAAGEDAAPVSARLLDGAVDLETGVIEAELRLGDAGVALRVRGFIDVVCRAEPGATPVTIDDPVAPPACAAVFDAIRQTRDDPAGPQPPWDLDAEDTLDE